MRCWSTECKEECDVSNLQFIMLNCTFTYYSYRPLRSAVSPLSHCIVYIRIIRAPAISAPRTRAYRCATKIVSLVLHVLTRCAYLILFTGLMFLYHVPLTLPRAPHTNRGWAMSEDRRGEAFSINLENIKILNLNSRVD